MLRLLEDGDVAKGDVIAYDQHVDPQEGSIVSHASAAFLSAR
jgi:hypothetical protein